MKDNLAEAQSLKEDARTSIEEAKKSLDTSCYEDALNDLDKARTLLFEEIAAIKSEPAVQKEITAKRLQDAGFEISDCYGMSGGIYRRMNQVENALDMYDKGYKFEANPEYKIQKSYNLGNRIVYRILIDPKVFSEMDSTIQEAIPVIQSQIDSTRERDWWAWADLGMLYILIGKEDLAINAYRKLKALRPPAAHLETIKAVLENLANQLQNYPAITKLLKEGVIYLNRK